MSRDVRRDLGCARRSSYGRRVDVVEGVMASVIQVILKCGEKADVNREPTFCASYERVCSREFFPRGQIL